MDVVGAWMHRFSLASSVVLDGRWGLEHYCEPVPLGPGGI